MISDGVKTVTGRDVERQNALDKAVGKALLAGMDLSRTALDEFARIPEYKVCAVRLEKIAEDGGEKSENQER